MLRLRVHALQLRQVLVLLLVLVLPLSVHRRRSCGGDGKHRKRWRRLRRAVHSCRS
jgi:hypothetical protein